MELRIIINMFEKLKKKSTKLRKIVSLVINTFVTYFNTKNYGVIFYHSDSKWGPYDHYTTLEPIYIPIADWN